MSELFSRRTGRRWRARLAAFAAALVAVAGLAAGTARAQFAPASTARTVPAGQRVNLFAEWEGGVPVSGFVATLPRGWQLEEAIALRGGTQRVALTVRPRRAAAGGGYLVESAGPLRHAVDLVLRVRTGPPAPSARWSLVPFAHQAAEGEEKPRESAEGAAPRRRLPSYGMERLIGSVEEPVEAADNYVLAFGGEASPLLLDRAQLPPLSTRAPFTVEAWVNTTGLGEVVLSTWDGTARRPYPLELVIGAGGRLRYYRGRPERHESMATPGPVADGTWHHIAVAHDPGAGRTRLLLDGAAVDSLRGTVPLEPTGEVVALGGRLPASGGAAAGASSTAPEGFTGQLDEVHFWPQARAPRAVRRTMRRRRLPARPGREAYEGATYEEATHDGAGAARFGERQAGPVLLHFEGDAWPPPLLTAEPSGVARVRSSLRLHAPIEDLRARAEPPGGVSLSWTAAGPGPFVVERSSDGGETFRAVGRREARAGGARRYSFTDADADADVVFYRVRQELGGGNARTSGTLKVGRGPDAREQQGVTLMGNFPNPFSEETTVAYQVHQDEARVRLSVWNLKGQRVATLVDKTQAAGYKEVVFRPQNLSSGTYFVRLRAGGEMQTRKVALVK